MMSTNGNPFTYYNIYILQIDVTNNQIDMGESSGIPTSDFLPFKTTNRIVWTCTIIIATRVECILVRDNLTNSLNAEP